MSRVRTLATALRVLSQLRRDRRTVAMIVVVPSFLMTLLFFVFDGVAPVFDRVAPPLLGVLPFILMFIITSVAMLRERRSGTLERLMSSPVTTLDLIAGYALAFAIVTVVQVAIASAIVLGPLGADVTHGTATLMVVASLSGVLGMALGLLASAFATTEFQAVQFMPMFVLPQLLLCGLFAPRDEMAEGLQWLAWLAPLTYVYDAIDRVASTAALGGQFWIDLAVVAGLIVVAIGLGALSLPRQTQ